VSKTLSLETPSLVIRFWGVFCGGLGAVGGVGFGGRVFCGLGVVYGGF